MAKYILFDTETTGGTQEDRIIQIGAMIVDGSGAIEVYDELCNTQIPIKLEAMEVHNITPDMIANKPTCTQTLFYKRVGELNSCENYLIAHNLPFDLAMLQKEGFENQLTLIDTLRCARHLLNDSPYHRLQYLRYSLELYKDEQSEANKHNITIKAHDAIGDVLVMKLLLSRLVSISKEKFPNTNPMIKLAELTTTPLFIEVFKFGKHKDKKVRDIFKEDANYIKWMEKNMQLDDDMKYTLDVIRGESGELF